MMASNVLSRLLPSASGSPSIYETLRQHDESDTSDIEDRAGMAVDEENLGGNFRDFELNNVGESQIDTGSPVLRPNERTQRGTSGARGNKGRRRPLDSPGGLEPEEVDDEVPASLLIEGDDDVIGNPPPAAPPVISQVPGPSNQETRTQWELAQAQQRLHDDTPRAKQRRTISNRGASILAMSDPKERAMWRWTNVENLDKFLGEVYEYFLGNGIWCILLSRLLSLLTFGFVVGFSTFLTMCVDYRKIPDSKTMSQILIPKCTQQMSTFTNIFLWLCALAWTWKFFEFFLDIRRLRHLHDFYLYLLEIHDTDIQTVSWQEVVGRLMALRDSNPRTANSLPTDHQRFLGTQSKQRMDAHDIANRLMRKENYLIALINKDILDFTLPIPFLRNRQLFSKTLEWNLNLCVLEYVFRQSGQVHPLFLKETHRRALSEGLRRRFMFYGFMNLLFAPFIVGYLVLFYFFRYFNEYQKNPAQLGSRQYSPLAQWKFREFNELWHLFQRRVNMSYPFASRYLDQFPKEKTTQISRFVAFVTGALASILALASVIDPELFLGFEITPDRTVLFYLGVFGTIWAVARGVVPEENLVFDPEFALNNVIEYTHYYPAHWRERLHSDEVRRQFSTFYQMKIAIFCEELLGIIFTPLILWFSLPKCSDRLIDFFREFTVHVDGLGYVCSFAVFDFQKGGNNIANQRQRREDFTKGLRDDYFSTKDGKMLASYYGFLDNYGPNPRPGAPYVYPPNKRQFYPPPAFPGLTSPTLLAEMIGPGGGKQDRWDRQHRPAGAGSIRSTHRTPKFGPAGAHASPMPSMLLDPHHQPSASGFRQMPRPSGPSRYRATRGPLDDPREDEEDLLEEGLAQTRGPTSSGSAGESNLGESWKTTRAGAVEEDEEDDEDLQAVAGEKGAGVLGLIYQFQKAQTEGRGPGVGL